MIESDFSTKVSNLLKEFKSPGAQKEIKDRGGSKIILPCDTRWCSYRDAFKCALKNLHHMKAAVTDKKVSMKIANQELLEDPSFEILLQDYIIIFDPVCELVNKCQNSTCNIADATELWLTLNIATIDEKYQNMIEARIKKAVRPICFAANLLHPGYQGRNMSKLPT